MVDGSLSVMCFLTGFDVGVAWLIRFLSVGVDLAEVMGSNCIPIISVGAGIVCFGMETLVLFIIVGSLEQPIQATIELKPKITNRYLTKTFSSL